MHEIFHQASNVFIWLGEFDKTTEMAFKELKCLVSLLKAADINNFLGTSTPRGDRFDDCVVKFFSAAVIPGMTS
jgi:hypothetical protein